MDEILMAGFAESVERIGAVAMALEGAVQKLAEVGVPSAEDAVQRIVATVESEREAELERKLAEAEQTIADLRASTVTGVSGGRKTVVAGAMVAKAAGNELGALDAALASLSLEQRFAVKAEMLRSGLLG